MDRQGRAESRQRRICPYLARPANQPAMIANPPLGWRAGRMAARQEECEQTEIEPVHLGVHEIAAAIKLSVRLDIHYRENGAAVRLLRFPGSVEGVGGSGCRWRRR